MPRVSPFPNAVLSTVNAAAGADAPQPAGAPAATTLPGRLTAVPLWVVGSLLLAVCCLFAGCGSSTDTMQRKLDKIANEDLQDIIAEIPEKARSVALAKPYFKVDKYKEFRGDTAIVYQAMATVVFFYLDPSLDLCQVRQYRYKTSSGIWDRYDVKLMHFPKKYSGIGPQ
jgi:hypothetical protein